MVHCNHMYFILNWKQNPESISAAKELLSHYKPSLRNNPNTIICPPAPFAGLLSPKGATGSQDISRHAFGSHTGESSGAQLASIGITHTIVGHSERRADGETPLHISEKVSRALENGITPILCFGETKRDTKGNFWKYLESDIVAITKNLSKKDVSRIIFAYEPVWAIGSQAKRTITTPELSEVVSHMKSFIAKLHGIPVSRIAMVYGGSVTSPEAVREYKTKARVNGFLVGRASLDATLSNQLMTAAYE